MLAGDSSLGEESMLMIDKMMLSTVWTGLHRSEALSWGFMGSMPGGCKIEMHTLPSGKTVRTQEKVYSIRSCHDRYFQHEISFIVLRVLL